MQFPVADRHIVAALFRPRRGVGVQHIRGLQHLQRQGQYFGLKFQMEILDDDFFDLGF